MSTFLKQPKQRATSPRKGKKAAQPKGQMEEPSGTKYLDINGINDIAASVDAIESALAGHFNNAWTGENKLAIFTGESGAGFHPVLIALEPSETMDRIIEASERIAKAFERIADAMTAEPLKR